MTRGSAEAEMFSELFDRAFADVWRFARRRVGSSADADDLAAEVFAVAWRRREGLPPPDEQRLWLFGVARNVVRNHQRTMYRRRRLSGRLAALAEANGVADTDISDHDTGLWLALSRLSTADRELLLLRSWDGLTIGDMAALLECSPNAVSVRLTKARGKLRQVLDEKDCEWSGDDVINPTRRGDR